MPHDKNGAVLTAGDQVLVPCTVKDVSAEGAFCNVTLLTDEPMPGNVSESCDGKSHIVLNAKQVVKCAAELCCLLLLFSPTWVLAAPPQAPKPLQAPPLDERVVELERQLAEHKASTERRLAALEKALPKATGPAAAATRLVAVPGRGVFRIPADVRAGDTVRLTVYATGQQIVTAVGDDWGDLPDVDPTPQPAPTPGPSPSPCPGGNCGAAGVCGPNGCGPVSRLLTGFRGRR